MTNGIPVVAIVFKTLTLLLGGVITYLASRAYVRTGAPGLGLLAIGFGVVTLGSLLAGVVDQVLLLDGGTAIIVESALTTAGFGIIMYSLYVQRNR